MNDDDDQHTPKLNGSIVSANQKATTMKSSQSGSISYKTSSQPHFEGIVKSLFFRMRLNKKNYLIYLLNDFWI